MGNTPSQEAFKVNGRPLAAYYDHEKVGTTVVTRTSFLYYNDKTHQLVNTVQSKKPISYVTYNFDLDLLITGEDDFVIRIYKASDGSFIESLPPSGCTIQELNSLAHNDHVKVILFIDDKHLLSGSTDGSIRTWNLETGEMTSVYVVSAPGRSVITDGAVTGVTALVYDEKNHLVIAGCADGIIRKFSVETRAVVGTFEGHNRGAILNLVLTNNGHLISSSMDETIRVWNVETTELVCGSYFFAQAFHYDSHRDILFGASDNGTVAVIKIENDPSDQSKYSLKKLSVLDFKLPALLNLYYNTYADCLTVTSIESNIGFLQNVTAIPHQNINVKRVRGRTSSIKNNQQNHQQNQQDNDNDNGDSDSEEDLIDNDPLSSEQLETILKQLAEIESNPSLIKHWSIDTLTNDRLSKLSQLGSDLFLEDDEISQIRLKKYNDGINELQMTRSELEEEFSGSVRSLLGSRAMLSALHVDTARMSKEMKLSQQRQELMDRHRRELEEFQQYYDREMEQFEQQQPMQSNRAAKQFLQRTAAYAQAQNDLELALNEHISTSFPVIASKYHIGGIISESATNVFGGFDAHSLKSVAIKLMPPGITLAAQHQHRHLTRVIETTSSPQASYIVMESCRMDLSELVTEFENHLLPIDMVKTIMYQLLDVLSYLHSNKMVKRDLTPSAVMVGDDNKVRITHLGLMKALTGQFDNEVTVEEGVLYGAPELFLRVITTESDMWAAGCLLVYLLQNEEERLRPLFDAHDVNSMIASTVRVIGRPTHTDVESMIRQCTSIDQAGRELLNSAINQPVPLEDTIDILKKHISRTDIDNDAFNLIQKLLTFVPQNRISAQQALSHRFFTNNKSISNNNNSNNNNTTTTTTTTTTSTTSNNQQQKQTSTITTPTQTPTSTTTTTTTTSTPIIQQEEVENEVVVGSTPVLKPTNNNDGVSPDTKITPPPPNTVSLEDVSNVEVVAAAAVSDDTVADTDAVSDVNTDTQVEENNKEDDDDEVTKAIEQLSATEESEEQALLFVYKKYYISVAYIDDNDS
ncbi:putative protein serine/threonine kinase [Heterostelium album PN500]|uniref:Protein kinase domain-containing protein n=1 Tax=Heterostelium pallidum (strain ATCC 26659 / Pp 5 / PN500) TaxID=670386 RepID=D3BKP0_HETP5|nr:putative protein serine/threonine kinase [Heterostelium album PN500]EFA78470.1 putative protein serine/threonine kinase [Heterostelium album PN500]|eukprot:XP_020430594.1 putative protein serine/threonine kinase [Heterostelium album PN500]